VVTVTAEFSLRGYCRTFSVRIACSPEMMITRLTTIASTGRRMKRSVKAISYVVRTVFRTAETQRAQRGFSVIGSSMRLNGSWDWLRERHPPFSPPGA
jgi:hypothetical protein